MRLVVDSMIALMLVGILAGVLWYHREQTRELETREQVHHALARLYEQALYHGALEQDHPETLSPVGFPLNISPQWFTDEAWLPLNVLVPSRQPWLDVAPTGDSGDHPPDPVIGADQQAGFWYNPARGLFRARVPRQRSDEQTLALYNTLNGVTLLGLPTDDDPARAPRKLQLSTFPPASAPGSTESAPASTAPEPAQPQGDPADGNLPLTAGIQAHSTLLGLPPPR
jgi:hypothetical protein